MKRDDNGLDVFNRAIEPLPAPEPEARALFERIGEAVARMRGADGGPLVDPDAFAAYWSTSRGWTWRGDVLTIGVPSPAVVAMFRGFYMRALDLGAAAVADHLAGLRFRFVVVDGEAGR